MNAPWYRMWFPVAMVGVNVGVGLVLGLTWFTVIGVGGCAFFGGATYQIFRDWNR